MRIGILETPTGFEVNAVHGWPERQELFFRKHLVNYHPEVTRIRTWRKDGAYSTQNPQIVDTITRQDFIYSGAGSPSYVIKHLAESRALTNLIDAHEKGTTLCFGSATAIASGSFAIPVYEIFKVGEDPYWQKGLGLFEKYNLRLAIVPHWDNREGEDFDSTRCWMGKTRFASLVDMLPPGVTALGIDETTAVLFDFHNNTGTVLGKGNAHVIKKASEEVLLTNGTSYPLSVLS